MKGKRKILSVLLAGVLVLVLSVVAFTGCPTPEPKEPTPPPEEPAPPPEPEYITVGSILPLSGPISVVGMSWSRGYELYFDKINEEGGVTIEGQPYLFKYISEDSKMNPEGGAAAARKLIYEDGATFVFGAIIEAVTGAIDEVCAEAGVPHLISAINVPGFPGVDVSPDKPLTVRPLVSFDTAWTIDFDYMLEAYPDVKKLAIAYPDLGYEGMIVNATASAELRGMEVVIVKPWDFFTTTDFVPIYTEVLAAKPDAILCMTSANAPEQMLAARQLGFTGPMISNVPLGPEVFVRIMGAEAATDVITNGINLDEPTEIHQEVMDRWAAKYNEPFVGDAVLAWDQAWILVQAMEKAQSVDGEVVIAALDAMTELGDLETSFGPGYMGEGERFGVNRVLVRPIPITRIMNGVIELIDYRYGSVE